MGRKISCATAVLAVALVAEHCAAANSGSKDEDASVPCVFRNGPKGWRVTMGNFSWGLFK